MKKLGWFAAGTLLAISGVASAQDGDGDGVPDSRDICPTTSAGLTVDGAGCDAFCEVEDIGTDIFIRSRLLEVGTHAVASFGSAASAPADWHPRLTAGDTRLGFVANPQNDDWTDYNGDFFVPGTPEEAWGLSVGASEYINAGLMSLNQIPGMFTGTRAECMPDVCGLRGGASVFWSGAVDGIEVDKTYSVLNEGLFILAEVVLTNTTGAEQVVTYMRNVDPDNQQPITGDFNTRNTIVSQGTGADGVTALVSAETDAVAGTADASYIALISSDPDARVTHGGFSNRSPNAVWDCGGGLNCAVGATTTGDQAISLAIRKTIPAGESVTISYAYTLDPVEVLTATECTIPSVCGDGIVEGTESCDDNNTTNGDGCDMDCRDETGYVCVGAPSVCTPLCGDGLIIAGEECDDSNTASGDGCSAMCAIEDGYECMGVPSVCELICVDSSELSTDTGCAAPTPHCETTGMLRCAECTLSGHCDDSNECTADACTANSCSNTNVMAGVACTGGVCDGSGTCAGCIDDMAAGTTDSGCSDATPACDDSGASPVCVECEVDADCGDGAVCSASNTCEVCIDTMTGSGLDNGCPASAPICAGAAGSGMAGTSCQPCLDDTSGMTDVGCELDGAAGPVCNTDGATNTCVPCENNVAAPATMDNGCMGDAIICLAPAGEAPTCVECALDADCTEAGTVCGAGNTCVPGCDMMDDCEGTDTPICDTAARECVECLLDSDCQGTESCDLTSNTCEQPDSDDDGIPDDEDLDDDNDGIPDSEELSDGLDGDSDDDGVLDYEDPDSVTCDDADADGVCDTAAEEVDFDGDGIPNHLDLDSDGDGVTDANEGGAVGAAAVDADGDGIIDGFADADGNGLSDNVQADPLPLPNTDGSEGPDFLDTDADDDGLPDSTEAHDADHDGMADAEASGSDTDGDGIDDAFDPDCVDAVCGGVVGAVAPTPDFDEDGAPNYQDADDDDDGIDTATEVQDAMDYEGPAPDGSDVDGDGNSNWFDTDSDGDGASDGDEDSRDNGGDGDLDANGILDYLDPGFTPVDTDEDGVPDSIECSTLPDLDSCEDSDGDGNPDYNDIDDDNDGVPTSVEGATDADGDSVPNHLDLDADNDGIPDLWENGGQAADANGDGMADDETDSDDDGLLDVYGEPGAPVNTDGDSLPDMLDLDSDGDGLLDIFEADGTDSDGDGLVDDATDTDGDGLADVVDVDNGGAIWPVPDTDLDGVRDFQDTDSDNDGAPDATEGWDGDMNGVGDVLPSGTDENGNGIDDAYEGQSPALPDTDSDDLQDWRDPDDDGDGINTEFENPTAQDTDGDGTPDYLDPDDDGDGTPTAEENPDENGDGNPDDAADSDMDGTPDYLDPDGGSSEEGGYAGGAFCSAGNSETGGLTLLSLLGMVALLGRRRRR